MIKKRALITGAAGQDGSYLCELLLEKGYDVHGLVKYSTAGSRMDNIKHLLNDIKIVEGDVTDVVQIARTLSVIKPHEVYNLASQSHVGLSFESPVYTANATGLSVLYILEGIRQSGFNSKFYQASTSEMFGNAPGPQNEETSFSPRSPYGCAKLYAHSIAKNYRESYNMFVCCGILFNHESPRRGENFVTRKIVKQAVEIQQGLRTHIELGNLDAKRDWGHAKDYVRGMHQMMQHNKPDDYVLATGTSYSVKDFLVQVFEYLLGVDYQEYVKINPLFLRPAEINNLVGDSTKAREVLGWKQEYTFKDLVKDMVDTERKKYVP